MKRSFDSAYAKYKEKRGDVAEVEPAYVKELLKAKCQEYFHSLKTNVTQTQNMVNDRIKNSNALQELESIMEKHRQVFEENSGEGFDQHKD